MRGFFVAKRKASVDFSVAAVLRFFECGFALEVAQTERRRGGAGHVFAGAAKVPAVAVVGLFCGGRVGALGAGTVMRVAILATTVASVVHRISSG